MNIIENCVSVTASYVAQIILYNTRKTREIHVLNILSEPRNFLALKRSRFFF